MFGLSTFNIIIIVALVVVIGVLLFLRSRHQ
jgi:hypothetical protein